MEILKKIIFSIYKIIFKFFGIIIPKNNKLIMFESFHGKYYSDNPRAIYEYLKENYPHFKMYWSVDPRFFKTSKHYEIKIVKRFSIRWLYFMNRAKYWVSNSRLPLWIPKPNKTVYIQTWHGTPLKKLALDMEEVHMPGTTTEKYKKNFIRESSKWDYLVSPNSYSTEIFKSAFKFNKNIIETGYPRNDFLVKNNKKSEILKIKDELGLPFNKKIILYAPTWRDNQYYAKGRYKFEIPMDLEVLKENLSHEYIIILRMHYLVAENLQLSKYQGFVYDFSNHEDIRDLYLISDVLITDYSSVFFDYAILNRPIIFYVFDIEEYRDKLRGFYFNFEKEAPGPLVKTTEQLINVIKRIETDKTYNKKLEIFRNKFCYLEDGNASKRVVEATIGNNCSLNNRGENIFENTCNTGKIIE